MKNLLRKVLTIVLALLLGRTDIQAQVNCSPADCTSGKYCIHYSEDFQTYDLGMFYPNPGQVQNTNWHQVYTTIAKVNPQIVEAQPGDKILRLRLNETQDSTSGLVSLPSLDPSSCFASAGSGIGPSGFTERNRWAVISEFYLRQFDANPRELGDHAITALRVRPKDDGTDQTRFGLSLQPKVSVPGAINGPNGSQAFLQFTSPNVQPPGAFDTVVKWFRLSDPVIPANNDGNGDYIFDFTPGTTRYAVTFEEWEQNEAPAWHLHFKGTVYRVDTSTVPWTYVNLGSFEWFTDDPNVNSKVCENTNGTGICVQVPVLSGSKLMFGEVFRQMDTDLHLLYGAFWKF